MSWIEETLQPNGVLKNKLGISDGNKLAKLEYEITTLKGESILVPRIQSIDDLKKIHGWLFKDLYDWAGEFREGDFYKGNTNFFPRSRFSIAIPNLDQQIKHINDTKYAHKLLLITDLAKLLIDLNNFHPFREGNGRTQRKFITLLAKQNGLLIHITPPFEQYDDYMKASVNDDEELMARVLIDSIKTDE
ncbi:Fic/DOC family protein [Companilactobacillus ginsenosidimutans]|uniref:protein adenylyltransferase n=1 Tax=Companilactobacillus ginsenosidimutans TaxID=1007676 RepID=A0A0H4QIB3_9LACO|nr:Fic family protein [Companilactobacillus ginsenosidimutans]AKP67682.1 hypothetical protein ABM34_09180 [Companilactobacillus ginsenosidimutans]